MLTQQLNTPGTRIANDTFILFSKEPQQLVFSSIQSSDSGQYDCTAENEAGEEAV